MGYFKKTIYMRNTIDIEKGYSSRRGKSITPGEKKKITPEVMKKINERNAVKKLKRLINNNFSSDDYHVTLTYTPALRPDKERAHKVLKSFLGKLKRRYRKLGAELKYIIVTEYEGKSIHHHMIVNDLGTDGVSTDKLIKGLWDYGRPKFSLLDDTGEYTKLAEYLVKETNNTFKDKSGPGKQRYSRSRNLVEPKEVVEEISAKKWISEPKPPKGYYIDKNSFFDGFSEFTGKRIQHYTCIKIGTRPASDRWKGAGD